jgi:hypothetical protein
MRPASLAIGTESGEPLGDALGVRSAGLEADLRVRFSPRPTDWRRRSPPPPQVSARPTCTVTHEMTMWLTRGHMRRHLDGHTASLEVGTEFSPRSLEMLSSPAPPTSRFLRAPAWSFARPRLFGREGDASAYSEYTTLLSSLLLLLAIRSFSPRAGHRFARWLL